MNMLFSVGFADLPVLRSKACDMPETDFYLVVLKSPILYLFLNADHEEIKRA